MTPIIARPRKSRCCQRSPQRQNPDRLRKGAENSGIDLEQGEPDRVAVEFRALGSLDEGRENSSTFASLGVGRGLNPGDENQARAQGCEYWPHGARPVIFREWVDG